MKVIFQCLIIIIAKIIIMERFIRVVAFMYSRSLKILRGMIISGKTTLHYLVFLLIICLLIPQETSKFFRRLTLQVFSRTLVDCYVFYVLFNFSK